MNYRSCVIVLIGQETYQRKWVLYEIKKAWEERRPMFGIYIHNLKDPRTGVCLQGLNPFSFVGSNLGASLSQFVKCYNPSIFDPYNEIKYNLPGWIEGAIKDRLY